MKIEIHKDFLDKDFFFKLKQTVEDHEFPWRFRPCLTGLIPNETFYFTFSFFNNFKINSDLYFTHIIPLLNKLKCMAPIEVRANLFLKKESIKSGWHTDNNFTCKVAILYLNTCNGGTELKLKDTTKFIKSEENKAIIFDSNIEHRSVIQTDTDRRLILNLNYF